MRTTTAGLIAATILTVTGPAVAHAETYDPADVACPAGSSPFDGTNACACNTDASVVLGQSQPDGSFEYWEEECPAVDYTPPADDVTEVLAETVTAPTPYVPTPADLNDIAAEPTRVGPAFTG